MAGVTGDLFFVGKEPVMVARKPKIDEWLSPGKLALIEGWARDGLSMEQIAQNMRINRRTLFRWKSENSTIATALETGQEAANYMVENALFKAATGYFYEETVEDESEVRKSKRTYRKYAKPDSKAMELWLKTKWSDRYGKKEQLEVQKLQIMLPDKADDNSSNLLEALAHVGDPDWNKPDE